MAPLSRNVIGEITFGCNLNSSSCTLNCRCDNEEAVIVISDDSNDAVATDISLTSAK